ncbi:hypothetical protein BSLA_03f1657 [Burkholderia stabilis]|nr:hypothetical protein BSLA_03f1657 [Burkholderia stabilis]
MRRRGLTHRIKELIVVVSRQSAVWGKPGAHERSLITAATIVDAVIRASAVDEEALSDLVWRAALADLVSLENRIGEHFFRHKL